MVSMQCLVVVAMIVVDVPKTEAFKFHCCCWVVPSFLQHFSAHYIYDICPMFGFGDNASGCCAQSVLFPKQKLSNSLAAAGWVVPSVPVQWGRCIFKMAAACTDKLGSTILEFEFLRINRN